MVAIRSHFTPTTSRSRPGDEVTVHVTNIEQTTDELHGFGCSTTTSTSSIDPGETKTVTFTAKKPGVFAYYCTNFCSALHQEMQAGKEERGEGEKGGDRTPHYLYWLICRSTPTGCGSTSAPPTGRRQRWTGRQGDRRPQPLHRHAGLARESFSEFQWMPFVIGAIGLLLLPPRHRAPPAPFDVTMVFFYFSAFSAWSFGYKLYRYGPRPRPGRGDQGRPVHAAGVPLWEYRGLLVSSSPPPMTCSMLLASW